MNKASMGKRLIAYIIDMVFIGVIIFTLGLVAILTSFVGSDIIPVTIFIMISILFVHPLYFTFQEASKAKATWGKRLLDLEVLNQEYVGLSQTKSIKRYLIFGAPRYLVLLHYIHLPNFIVLPISWCLRMTLVVA